jgi:hypothetical protein
MLRRLVHRLGEDLKVLPANLYCPPGLLCQRCAEAVPGAHLAESCLQLGQVLLVLLQLGEGELPRLYVNSTILLTISAS